MRTTLLVAIAAWAAAGAGCRREPKVAERTGDAGTEARGPALPAAEAGGPAAAPVAPAGPQEIVPPVPSGWVSGARFTPPPPIVLDPSTLASGTNLLRNPGFEEGTAPWWYFPDRPHWGGFTASTSRALSGRWAARLELLVDAAHPPPDKAHIKGIIQDLQGPVFPSRLSGAYFVETWERSRTDQYLQFVVIVAAGPMTGGRVTNRQIRYLLAGIDHPPFGIANAKFIYISREQPVVGQWVRFERDLRQDFLEQWGEVPEDFGNVRVLFEMRWDNMDVAAPTALHGVAYFDDLFLGT